MSELDEARVEIERLRKERAEERSRLWYSARDEVHLQRERAEKAEAEVKSLRKRAPVSLTADERAKDAENARLREKLEAVKEDPKSYAMDEAFDAHCKTIREKEAEIERLKNIIAMYRGREEAGERAVEAGVGDRHELTVEIAALREKLEAQKVRANNAESTLAYVVGKMARVASDAKSQQRALMDEARAAREAEAGTDTTRIHHRKYHSTPDVPNPDTVRRAEAESDLDKALESNERAKRVRPETMDLTFREAESEPSAGNGPEAEADSVQDGGKFSAGEHEGEPIRGRCYVEADIHGDEIELRAIDDDGKYVWVLVPEHKRYVVHRALPSEAADSGVRVTGSYSTTGPAQMPHPDEVREWEERTGRKFDIGEGTPSEPEPPEKIKSILIEYPGDSSVGIPSATLELVDTGGHPVLDLTCIAEDGKDEAIDDVRRSARALAESICPGERPAIHLVGVDVFDEPEGPASDPPDPDRAAREAESEGDDDE